MQSVRQTAILGFTAFFFVFAVPSAQAGEESITLDYVMTNRAVSATVESGQLRYETARNAASAAGIGTDPALTISPTTKLSGDEGDPDPTKATVTASFGLSIPLGLTEDQHRRATSALERLETAAAALAEAKLLDVQEVVRLYHVGYLAQREREVTRLELEAVRVQLDSERVRFEQGELRFSEFLQRENEFSDAEAELADAEASWRDAVRNLSVATSIQLSEVVSLAPPPLVYEKVGALHEEQIGSQDYPFGADLMGRYYTVLEAEREAAQTSTFLSLANVRASLDYLEHQTSVSFTPGSRILALSYTPEGVVLRDELQSSATGSGGSSTADPDWSLNISVGFTLSPSRVETYDYQTAQLAVEQAQLELAKEQQRVATETREADLLMARTLEAVESAAKAVERAEINLGVVLARDVVQQIRPAELRAAEAALQRALLSLERAELYRDQQFLERLMPSSDVLGILTLPVTWRTE